jgi:hypothetical protein
MRLHVAEIVTEPGFHFGANAQRQGLARRAQRLLHRVAGRRVKARPCFDHMMNGVIAQRSLQDVPRSPGPRGRRLRGARQSSLLLPTECNLLHGGSPKWDAANEA